MRHHGVMHGLLAVTGMCIAVAAQAAVGFAPANDAAITTMVEAGRSAPVLTAVTPNTLQPGQAYALQLKGPGLKTGMGINLGAGISAGTVSVINDTLTVANVQVAADAQPGPRSVLLTSGNQRYPQRVTVTVQVVSVQAVAVIGGFNRTAPQATTMQAPPGQPLQVLQVTPMQLRPGSQYLLSLTGSGFAGGLSLDFGQGISLLRPPQVTGNSNAVAEVRVETSAPAGRRLVRASLPGSAAALMSVPQQANGPAAVEVLGATQAGGRLPGFAPFAGELGVIAPQMPGPGNIALFKPKLTSVSPKDLFQGESYTLTLQGEFLTPAVKLDLGAGIEVKGVLMPQPGGAKVGVQVQDAALPGTRPIKLAAGADAAYEAQAAEVAVLAKVFKAAPAVVKLPAVNLEKVAKGVIQLDTPAWRKQTGSQMPPKDPISGKPLGPPTPIYKDLQPTLDDTQLFIWHEIKKGLAERYEIRFFKGDKLLAKRSLPAPTGSGWGSIPHYRPDAALIGELFQAIKPSTSGAQGMPSAAQTVKASQGVQKPVAAVYGGSNSESVPGSLGPALAHADIAWEVAGFRKYAKNGVAKSALLDGPILLAAAGGFAPKASQNDAPKAEWAALPVVEMVDVEVEISERWPLYLGAAPTGLNCGSGKSAGVSVVNIDSTMQKGKLTGASGFTYERFEVQGQLNLGKSPYAAHADKAQASTPDTQTTVSTGFGGSITMGSPSEVIYTTWSFDNVFVDWGDGSMEPLSVMMGGDAGDYDRGDALNLTNSAIKYRHAYTSPGSYTVRLFQLGEDDIQGGGQQVAAVYADLGKTSKPVSLYHAAVQQGGGGQATQAEAEYGKAVASRAYMVFCQNLSIQPRTDPAANGPLKLVDIQVQGVSTGADLPKAGAGKSGKTVQASSAKLLGKADQAAPGGKGAAKVGTSVAGAMVKATDQGALTAEMVQANFSAMNVFGGMPVYSSCDYQLSPYATLHFTGQGEVRTRWYVDGYALPEDASRPVGPSQSRPDSVLKNPPEQWGPPLVSSINLPAQTPIGLEKLGKHSLRVEAEALPDSVNLFTSVAAALGGDPGAKAALGNAAKGGNLPKLGILAAPKVPVKGGGVGPGPVVQLRFGEPATLKLAAASKGYAPVQSYTDALPAGVATLATKKDPPVWAVSPEQPYLVVGSDPSQPCTFDFPVNDGKFRVVGLQAPGGKPKVTRSGDRFSGEGDLLVPIPGGGTQKAALNFADWRVASDGITVEEGQFSLSKTGFPEVPMAALKGRFTRLDGVAGKQVDAWLDAQLANMALTEAASATKVPRWQGVKASLSPDGDWFAEAQSMPEFLVYDSGARIQPQAVVLDLSSKQGASPGAKCGTSGAAWQGIALGKAEMQFTNFDMPGAKPKAALANWGINGDGLCGDNASSGPESHDWMRGKIAWKGISARAEGGAFYATYDDLSVYVPWLKTTLTGSGDPVLKAGKGQGQGGIVLNLKGEPKTLTHGPVKLRVSNLAFTKTELGGGSDPLSLPAASSDACFDFQGESQLFAKDVCVSGLHFALDGRAYFAGSNSQTVSLAGQSGKIAHGTVSLKEVKVSAGGGSERLGFDFLSDLKISQALPAVPVPVSYRITEPATDAYTGSGPVTGSFEVKFDSPLVKANIKPSYTGPKDGTSVAASPVMLAQGEAGSAVDVAPFQVASADANSIVFKGDVDLSQFQSAVPLKGAFLLGYNGDTDFWATKFTWALPTGIVLLPGVLSLYEFGGGLGFHVTRDSLVGTSLDFVEFSPDATPVLNAMARVGSAWDTGFTVSARGDLNIKPGGGDAGVDMVYTAWLLSNDHSGMGPVSGSLGYGGGVFYGNMGGKWGPPGLDEWIYVSAPPDAIGFSMGGDEWYFRVGTQDSPVTGHVLILDQGSWMDFSSTKGLHVGAKANARFPNVTCDGTCAYVEGMLYMDAGLQLNPIRFDASGGGSVSANACYKGHCVGFGTSIGIYAGAPNPVRLGYGLSIDLPCPLPDVDFTVKVLPSVGFGWDTDSCLW